MNNEAYHSGAVEADNSQTPWWLIRQLESVVNVDIAIDVCATEKSAKAGCYWTKEDNCFSKYWAAEYMMTDGVKDALWMNPPFSLASEFTQKAAIEANLGCVILGCVKHAPDADWFQKVEQEATFIYVPDGRIQFLDANGNPFMREKKIGGVGTGEFVKSGANFPVCFPLWTPFNNGGSAKQVRFIRDQEGF